MEVLVGLGTRGERSYAWLRALEERHAHALSGGDRRCHPGAERDPVAVRERLDRPGVDVARIAQLAPIGLAGAGHELTAHVIPLVALEEHDLVGVCLRHRVVRLGLSACRAQQQEDGTEPPVDPAYDYGPHVTRPSFER